MKRLLLAGALLLLANSDHATAREKTVDASVWRVEEAETVQRRTELESLRKGAADKSDEALEERRRIDRALTGVGRTHGPRQEVHQSNLDAPSRQMREFHELAVQLAAREKLEVAEAMRRVAPDDKASTLALTLGTVAEGPISTGGYVFAYTPAGGFVYSAIGAGGQITLTATPGTVVDLYVHPRAPYAAQVIVGVTVQPGASVTLKPGRRTPVLLTSLSTPAYAGAISGQLQFRANGTSSGVISLLLDTTFGPTPAIYLADDHTYDLTAQVELPWLANPRTQLTSAIGSIAVEVYRGFLLDIAFVDSANLVTGCTLRPSLSVRSENRVTSPTVQLSVGSSILDPQNRVVGVRAAVPKGRPVDVELTFSESSGGCSLQAWRLDGARFVEDARERLVLRRRPSAQVTFRTRSGEALSYNYGYIYPSSDYDTGYYFGPTGASSTSLIAGEEYVMVLNSSHAVSIPSTRFVAQAGPFPVVVEVDRLVTVAAKLTAEAGMSMSGLLELRQGSTLVAAFEVYSGRDFELRVPAGDYVVNLSGLGGNYRNPSNFEQYAILMREFSVARTFSDQVGQRLDIPLSLPTSGIRFNLSSFGFAFHLTAFDAARPIAATVVYPWYLGVRTDLPSLNLKIRGPRFDDLAATFQPSPDLPMADLGGMAAGDARFTGVLRGSTGALIVNSPVYQYSEGGLFARSSLTDAQGRFDLPKVRGSLVTFLAPDAGSDLMAMQKIDTPNAVLPSEIRLQSTAFRPIDPSGPALQPLFGAGNSGYKIVFLSEGYTSLRESFTDQNGNGVWDALLFIDLNKDGLWQRTEPLKTYGNRVYPSTGDGTNVSAANEPFLDQNADGYPSIDDFSVYVQNAKNYVRSLLGTVEIRSGLQFDAYLLFLPSNQAGMDIVDTNDQMLETRDTRFGAVWDLDRSLINIDGNAARAAIAGAVSQWDLQVVMINQPVPAGRVNSFILANGGVGNTSPNDLVAGHEFGHNPGQLADEYDEFAGTSVQWISPALQHLTHVPNDLQSPWQDLLRSRSDAPIAIPNSPGIGMYAGGSYQAGGAYRPSSTSRMRNNSPEFNAPSLRRMRQAFCTASLSEAQLILPPRANASDLFLSGFEPSNVPVGKLCQ